MLPPSGGQSLLDLLRAMRWCARPGIGAGAGSGARLGEGRPSSRGGGDGWARSPPAREGYSSIRGRGRRARPFPRLRSTPPMPTSVPDRPPEPVDPRHQATRRIVATEPATVILVRQRGPARGASRSSWPATGRRSRWGRLDGGFVLGAARAHRSRDLSAGLVGCGGRAGIGKRRPRRRRGTQAGDTWSTSSTARDLPRDPK